LDIEDARIVAATAAGRNVALFEIRNGHTSPRNWDKDGVHNAGAFSHLAAVGFTRLGCRMYSQTFIDAYQKTFNEI
jgi:hypothetical protein